MRRLALAGLAFALSASFYLLLIDNVQLPELYVLCGVGLLATAAFWISREQGVAEAAIAPRWLRSVWRPLVRVPGHIGLVCAEAIAQLVSPKRSRGEFLAVSFRGGDDAHDYGRRALTEALGSLAPNTIVIGIDADRELLLVHRLSPHGDEQLDVLRLG